MLVYLVRDNKGKVKTWLSDKHVADFLAEKLNGSVEVRFAVYDFGTTYIVDKEIEFGIEQNTHDDLYRKEYNEHKKKLKEIIMTKLTTDRSLSADEVKILLEK